MTKFVKKFLLFIDTYLLLVIVSLVSAYLTTKLIFPAFFISIPITLYGLTKRAISSHWKGNLNGSFNDLPGLTPFILIGTCLCLQLVLPVQLWGFGFDEYQLRHFLPLYLYVSFVFLALFVYYEDGKLVIKDDDDKQAEDFYFTIFKILFIQPGVLFISAAILHFVLTDLSPSIVIFLLNLL